MELYKNTFNGGWKTDISKYYQPNNTYRDLIGATITADDDGYVSVVNIRSSENIGGLNQTNQDSITATPKLLSSVFCNWRDTNGTKLNGILLFYVVGITNDNWFRIAYYDFDASVEYIVYEENGENPDKYYNNDVFFQTKLYSELGTDIVYFTDGLRQPRVIHCDSTKYSRTDIFNTSSLILEEELELFRLTPREIMPNVEVSEDEGSLISGSYQFAYQLYSSKRNVYSKFSQLSNPVSVSERTIFGFLSGTGGIATSTNRAIDVSINLNSDTFEDVYDTFRIAVVKNVDGTLTPSTSAYIVLEEKIADYTSNGAIEYTYKGNENDYAIPIEDITINDSDIASFSTFEIERNVLMAGGIEYKDLQASPSFTDASVIESTPDELKYIIDYDRSDNKKGYFRDEVYRFAISYYDSYGHFSEPEVLDFTSSTGNVGDSSDFKFPDRNKRKVIKDSNVYSDSFPSNLGLRITGITDHPSWAKGFVILRQKRKKNIVSQTPLIPTQIVEPAFATADTSFSTPYPGDGNTLGDSNGTYMPKNMRNAVTKHILRKEGVKTVDATSEESQFFVDFKSKTERQDAVPKHSMNVSVLYPETFIYQNGLTNLENISLKGSRIRTVDICFLQNLNIINNNYISETLNSNDINNAAKYGDYIEFESTAFLRADRFENYYFTSGDSSGLSIRDELNAAGQSADIFFDSPISEYREMPNFGDKVTLTSVTDTPYNFGAYTDINSSLNEGYDPVNVKSAVVVTSINLGDIAHKCTDVTPADTASDNGVVKRENIFSSNIIGRISATETSNLSNDMVSQESNIVANAVRIVNIEKGLNDDRYGDINSYGEFIHTGSYHKLTDSEITNNTPIDIDIWGGDCVISRHTFKVNSSTYAIAGYGFNSQIGNVLESVRQTTNTEPEETERYGNFFGDNSPTVFSWKRPIGLKSNSVFVTVWLEGTVDGTLKTPDIIKSQSNPSSGVKASTAGLPMDYEYNFSYSIGNENKVFIKTNPIEEGRKSFPSRIVYSSGKVYQTSQVGFDTFPVDNIYDMDESYGKLTRLITTGGDRTYAFQEEAISYLPIQANIIQSDDIAQLSVRTSDFIGNYKYITTETGVLFPESIVSNGAEIYFYSFDRNSIYKLSGSNLTNIGVESGIQSKIREVSEFANVGDSRIMALYDETRSHVLFSFDFDAFQKDVLRYDEKLGMFVGRTGSYTGSLQGGISYDGDYYLLGNAAITTSTLTLWKHEEGSDYGTFLDSTTDGRVDIIISPDKGTCTYDVVTLIADNYLKSLEIVSPEEGGQNSLITDIEVFAESNYRIRKLRDAFNRRIRGSHVDVILRWNHTDPSGEAYKEKVSLHNMLTRYRLSYTPF